MQKIDNFAVNRAKSSIGMEEILDIQSRHSFCRNQLAGWLL